MPWALYADPRAGFRYWDGSLLRSSYAMFDPYSLVHAGAGSLQCLLLPPIKWVAAPQLALVCFAANFALHLGFEVIENSPAAVRAIRARSARSRYAGDTVVNTIGDLLSFCAGYLLTRVAWDASRRSPAAAAVPLPFLAAYATLYVLRAASSRR